MSLALVAALGALLLGMGQRDPNLPLLMLVAAITSIFLTDVAGLRPDYAGWAIGASRLWDAVNDPLFGLLSDRIRTRWGRRRVWMAASVPVLMLAVYKLFMPDPADVNAGYLLGWLVALWVGWTMLFIPYYAWAAELSPDYNERTRITGWRSWIGMAAIFCEIPG